MVKYCLILKSSVLFVISRVQDAIMEEASEVSAASGTGQLDPRIISKVKKKARRILQEMVANVSPALIRY